VSSTLGCVTLLHWQRYAALGDAGAWSVRLAGILQGSARLRGEGFEYADFAESPGLVRGVVELQVPRALSMRADLVSIVVGSSDLASPDADAEALAYELDAAEDETASRARAQGWSPPSPASEEMTGLVAEIREGHAPSA